MDEDWSVADLFSHLLKIPADVLLPQLCTFAGRPISENAILEDVIFWPRLLFGRKTIHPDVVAVFDRHVVLFEFKRPAGASLPPWEISGQVSFATHVNRTLGHDWSLFIIPGPSRSRLKTAPEYANDAKFFQDDALTRFGFGPEVSDVVRANVCLEDHIRVMSWEQFLEHSDKAVAQHAPHSWQTRRVRTAIREFHRTRSQGAGFEPLRVEHVA